MYNKMSLEDVDLKAKRVFCRVDFNVPVDDGGHIEDDSRISAVLRTIRYILDRGGKLILASHLGRPKGERNPKYSLAPVAPHLGKLLGQEIKFAPDCIGTEVKKMVFDLAEGDVILLENVRFHPEEENNDPIFSRKLASLAEVYVNDAFSTAHRAHASTVGVAQILNPAVAGLLMEEEIRYLGGALTEPKRAFVAVLGGAKAKDKIPVIRNLLNKVNAILIGGGMAYTFLKAQGVEVGKSLVQEDQVKLAGNLLREAQDKGVELLLPEDHVVAPTMADGAPHRICRNAEFPADQMGVDIGPETVKRYVNVLKTAGTVVWNGPMGVFEMDDYAVGTFAVARALADSRGVSIIGGGDSMAAVKKAGVQDHITHISTGGGAMLEFLEGKKLPGIQALNDKK
jgi:phosphoglycerate kinase